MTTNNRVKHFADRIRSLEEEKKTLTDDINDILEEAEGEGIDKKALRLAMRLARMDGNARKKADEYESQLAFELAPAA